MEVGIGSSERGLLERALPRYEIGEVIGRGAWGVVVAARHRDLARHAAVKVLRPDLVDQPGTRHRFVVEAQLLARLDHPHVVPIYDYLEHEGACILVMELLTGGSLADLVQRHQVDGPTACGAVVDACSGLAHAHRAGVLHRDIKPDNLMLAADGTLKVADFGIATVVGDVSRATAVGEVLGSPAYMAPEQITGHPLGPATDVYGVATVLYELLAGRLPHPIEGDAVAVAYRHVHEEPVPLRRAALSVPEPIARAVMAGLASDPRQRPACAEDFSANLVAAATEAWGPDWYRRSAVPVTQVALADAGSGDPGRIPATRVLTRSRRAPWLAMGVVAAVVLVGVAWALVGGGDVTPGSGTEQASTAVVGWSASTGGPIIASPIVAADAVIVGSDDGVLRALDVSSGTSRWTYGTDAPIRATPAVDGDVVYAAGFDGAVHAVAVGSGQRLWRRSLGFEVFASPAVIGDTVIIAADALHALDVSDGSSRWTFALPEPSVSSPVVSHGLTIFGDNDGVVRAVDVEDGTLRWQLPTGSSIKSSPAVDGDTAYVGSESGALLAIDIVTGTMRWQVEVAGPVNSSPAIVGDSVVVGDHTGVVSVLRASGEVQWRFDAGARVDASPVAVDGEVVVGDDAGVVHALAPADGTEQWSFATEGSILGRAVDSGDQILVGSSDGYLRSIAPVD